MRLVMRALLAAVILPAAMGGQGLLSAGAFVDPAHEQAIRVRVEPVPLRLAGAAYKAPGDTGTGTSGTDATAGTGATTPAAPPAGANTTTTVTTPATAPASATPDVSGVTPATPPAGS